MNDRATLYSRGGTPVEQSTCDALHRLYSANGLDDPLEAGFGYLVSTHLLVLRVDGRVCGAVEYHVSVLPENKDASIQWICAERGFGDKLLLALEEVAKSQGRDVISGWASLDVDESECTVLRRLNFFIKNGFRADKLQPLTVMGACEVVGVRVCVVKRLDGKPIEYTE